MKQQPGNVSTNMTPTAKLKLKQPEEQTRASTLNVMLLEDKAALRAEHLPLCTSTGLQGSLPQTDKHAST